MNLVSLHLVDGGVHIIDEGPEKGLHPPSDNSPAHFRDLFCQYFTVTHIVPVQRMRQVKAQTIVATQPIKVA